MSKRTTRGSVLEEQLLAQIRAAYLPEPEREYRFCDTRQWRFDMAWPAHALAVEVEGGVWSRGRHTRAIGYQNDCEKYNSATLFGWRVLRYTERQVNDGTAIREIALALAQDGG